MVFNIGFNIGERIRLKIVPYDHNAPTDIGEVTDIDENDPSYIHVIFRDLDCPSYSTSSWHFCSEFESVEDDEKPNPRKFKFIKKHYFIADCVITEFQDKTNSDFRRYYITIRGDRGWKLYEGKFKATLQKEMMSAVSILKDKIAKNESYGFEGWWMT